jgi:glyoxylase-like metal-dependent hydrolase (beta-lactamase superfamily II)/rhodanese-related sulfurtransferase
MMGGSAVEIVSVVDEGLGHSSHLVALADGTALVIDPARFPDRQRRVARERGWRILWTADTHSHADYVSGSPGLAVDSAVFLAPAQARLQHRHRGVEPGEEIDLGAGVVMRAIGTPGHTPDHLAYLLVEDGGPRRLFSGGSLMVGTVGRTDLMGDDRQAELAGRLFRALRDEILTLPDDVAVYPTHGAGSFCSAPTTSDRTTTIGRERATNPWLQIRDEQEFIDRLTNGMGSFPSYFRVLPERNRLGPRRYPTLPKLRPLTPNEVARQLDDGAVLVDARPIRRFAAGHVPGALSNALRPVFGSWLGWLVDLDRHLVFVLDDDQNRAELVRQCLTIGHEHLVGELDGGVAAWAGAGRPLERIRLADPATMPSTVLDVRQDAEWQAGHLPGAVHVELGTLSDGAPPPDGSTVVMCGHGERAMTAASVLAARGHAGLSVLTGGPQEWAAATGAPLVTGT